MLGIVSSCASWVTHGQQAPCHAYAAAKQLYLAGLLSVAGAATSHVADQCNTAGVTLGAWLDC